MDKIPAQEPVVVNRQVSSKRNLIISIVILIVLGTIVLFWLNFFGGFKIIDILKPTTITQKQVSLYQKQINQTDLLTTSLNSLSEPLNPRVSKDAFLGLKKQIDIELQAAKEAFAKGDVETSRTNLLKARTDIVALGDPLEMVFIPKELKEKHDPNDKYIQKERVDPRLRNMYLELIDLQVGTDKKY